MLLFIHPICWWLSWHIYSLHFLPYYVTCQMSHFVVLCVTVCKVLVNKMIKNNMRVICHCHAEYYIPEPRLGSIAHNNIGGILVKWKQVNLKKCSTKFCTVGSHQLQFNIGLGSGSGLAKGCSKLMYPSTIEVHFVLHFIHLKLSFSIYAFIHENGLSPTLVRVLKKNSVPPRLNASGSSKL